MIPLSIVIITRNEAENITDCIYSAKSISDDIIVVDCGSSDDTCRLAELAGAKVITVAWNCYGHSRNAGAEKAKNDWIISLDADERITPSLTKSIRKIKFTDCKTIYGFRRHNYFIRKKIRFGSPGFEKVFRIYNRNQTWWDLAPVHESLYKNGMKKIIVRGGVLHFTIRSRDHYRAKLIGYANLSAYKYLQQNRPASFIKRFISPVFNASKSYIFQLGFLDGKEGFIIAKWIAYYTWLKYHYLHEINNLTIFDKDIAIRQSANNEQWTIDK